jgi:hypothetical protein
MVLLYYCETIWLSPAKVLYRVFEFKEKTSIFISDSNNNQDSDSCDNGDFNVICCFPGD